MGMGKVPDPRYGFPLPAVQKICFAGKEVFPCRSPEKIFSPERMLGADRAYSPCVTGKSRAEHGNVSRIFLPGRTGFLNVFIINTPLENASTLKEAKWDF